MEKQIKTKGIILRKINFGEADQILTILTKDEGKISALAKGARRLKSKFLGKLELFYNVDLNYFQGRELAHLNEVESFVLLQEENLDLKSRSLLFYMAEATHKLVPEGQECQKIYDLLKEVLIHFEKTTSEGIFYAYMVKLLSELGFMANWDHCQETNDKLNLDRPYFMSTQDANLTLNPSTSISGKPVNPTIIKWVNYMQKEELAKLKNIKSLASERAEVFFVLKSILGTVLNHPFKSEAFMQLI